MTSQIRLPLESGWGSQPLCRGNQATPRPEPSADQRVGPTPNTAGIQGIILTETRVITPAGIRPSQNLWCSGPITGPRPSGPARIIHEPGSTRNKLPKPTYTSRYRRSRQGHHPTQVLRPQPCIPRVQNAPPVRAPLPSAHRRADRPT